MRGDVHRPPNPPPPPPLCLSPPPPPSSPPTPHLLLQPFIPPIFQKVKSGKQEGDNHVYFRPLTDSRAKEGERGEVIRVMRSARWGVRGGNRYYFSWLFAPLLCSAGPTRRSWKWEKSVPTFRERICSEHVIPLYCVLYYLSFTHSRPLTRRRVA